MRIPLTAASLFCCLLLINSIPAWASEGIVPVEKRKPLGTLPLGFGAIKKAVPDEGKVNLKKEDVSDSSLLAKKDPLISIEDPRPGIAGRPFQKFSGKVGKGITKVFLRINEDTQIIAGSDGRFEGYGALRPGINTVTAIAWDLEGNLGKDSLKIICRPDAGGPHVSIQSPANWSSINITDNRVITVTAASKNKGVTGGYLVINNIPRRVAFEKGVMKQDVALFPGMNEIYIEAEGRDEKAGRSETVKVLTFDARPKDLAAILTWDSPTADLDLHVWDSFGHHTFNDAPDPYSSNAAIPGGSLDMDRKGSYGPEVFSLETASQEVYTFYVKYNPGLKDKGASAYLRLILYGEEPSRRIVRSFGPVFLSASAPAWEAAHVKMPEGVFFQEKDLDLAKTFGMDAKAVKRLSLMLEEESPAFRLLAISAMGQIKSEEAVTPLLKALSDESPEIRRAAAGALWNIKSVTSVQRLVNALRDTDAEVRRAAAGALGNIGDKSALSPMTTLLTEEADPSVRVEIIRALGRLGDAQALDAVASQTRDGDLRVRAEAIRALGALADPGAERALTEALEDKEEGVRGVAAWALGKLGAKGAVKALSDMLRFDRDEGVRAQAALALGAIKDGSCSAELERAREKDASGKVRASAGKALEALLPASAKSAESPAEMDDDLVIY